tara:strand:- start:988 stop:1152 length:165 start_codon:yes stop_codon:yes gene_type:complete
VVELLEVPHPLVELVDQVAVVLEHLDLEQLAQDLLIPVVEVEADVHLQEQVDQE